MNKELFVSSQQPVVIHVGIIGASGATAAVAIMIMIIMDYFNIFLFSIFFCFFSNLSCQTLFLVSFSSINVESLPQNFILINSDVVKYHAISVLFPPYLD